MDLLSCKLQLKSASDIAITGINSSLPPHLTACVGQTKPAHVRKQYPTTDRVSRALSSTLMPRAQAHGPVAEVLVGDERNVGYRCHPAVADSSMHIGILAGPDDGRIRIPGKQSKMIAEPHM